MPSRSRRRASDQGRLAEVEPRPGPGRPPAARHRAGAAMLGQEGRLRLGEPLCGGLRGVFRLGQHPAHRRPASLRDAIARDPAGMGAGDPVLQRQRLRHPPLDHRRAHRLAAGALAHHHRLVHLGRHGQHRARLGQPPQDPPGLLFQPGLVLGRGIALTGFLVTHVASLLCCPLHVRTAQRPPQMPQRLVDQKIVPQILDPPHLPQHRRRMAPRLPRQRPDRHPALGMRQIAAGIGRNPARQLNLVDGVRPCLAHASVSCTSVFSTGLSTNLCTT